MNRLLLVAHAPLASALKAAALHAFPECAVNLEALDVPAQASLEDTRTQVRAWLQLSDEPVLVLVDVAGATPANAVAAELAAAPHARALAGVNVAMLWRTLCYRHEDPDALLARASEGGLRGVQPLVGLN